MLPTSAQKRHSKDLQRLNPKDPTLLGSQAAPINCTIPSCREGWLPSVFHQKLILMLSMVQYVSLGKHLKMIPSIILVLNTTASAWNWLQRGHLLHMTTFHLPRPAQPVPDSPFRYQRLLPLHLHSRGNRHSQPVPWFINQPLKLRKYPPNSEQEYHEGDTPATGRRRESYSQVQARTHDT